MRSLAGGCTRGHMVNSCSEMQPSIRALSGPHRGSHGAHGPVVCGLARQRVHDHAVDHICKHELASKRWAKPGTRLGGIRQLRAISFSLNHHARQEGRPGVFYSTPALP